MFFVGPTPRPRPKAEAPCSVRCIRIYASGVGVFLFGLGGHNIRSVPLFFGNWGPWPQPCTTPVLPKHLAFHYAKNITHCEKSCGAPKLYFPAPESKTCFPSTRKQSHSTGFGNPAEKKSKKVRASKTGSMRVVCM